jgi:hypothetical protein|tara:strand:- start:942 stop:1154 length:213 start_codon:yes stop_codon:yes gene_type:complete
MLSLIKNPEIMQWILLALASVCTFMIGYLWSNKKQEETVENTIVYLCDNGFIKHRTDENGETEILRLDED